MKIKNIKRTKRHFRYYHRRLWKRIIVLLTNDKKGTFFTGSPVKDVAMTQLFDVGIAAGCFGCEWDTEYSCFGCLFDLHAEYSDGRGCLNGLWREFDNNPSVELANKIRDFPIKQE